MVEDAKVAEGLREVRTDLATLAGRVDVVLPDFFGYSVARLTGQNQRPSVGAARLGTALRRQLSRCSQHQCEDGDRDTFQPSHVRSLLDDSGCHAQDKAAISCRAMAQT